MKNRYGTRVGDETKAAEKGATPCDKRQLASNENEESPAVIKATSSKKRQRKTHHTWYVMMKTSATLTDALRNYRHEFRARKEKGAGALESPSELARQLRVPSFFGEPPTPARRSAIVKELTEQLSDALERHGDFGKARQLLRTWKAELLPAFPRTAPYLDWLTDLQWEGGETGFRAEVVEDLTLLVEAFSRPVRFYNRLAPHHEVQPGYFGPYPKRKEIDTDAEERSFTAKTLGQTLDAFGVAALLNDDVRRAFLDLARHALDFAKMLAIAEGRTVAGTYGRPRKKDRPEAERVKKKRRVLVFYWSVHVLLDEDASIAERAASVRFLKAYCKRPDVQNEIKADLETSLSELWDRGYIKKDAGREALRITGIAFPKRKPASIKKLVLKNPRVKASRLK